MKVAEEWSLSGGERVSLAAWPSSGLMMLALQSNQNVDVVAKTEADAFAIQ
jgi:phosphotransferase system HPr-like phosphotransfer protein